MKEKRIDMYLSIASAFHLGLAGFGGTLAFEVIAEHPRPRVLNLSLLMFAISFVATFLIYRQVQRKTRQKK